MKIRNKLESIEAIKELGLNKFPEKLFKFGEEDKVIDFINKNEAKYYAIRDKSNATGIFKLKVEASDILKEIKDYELFTINVSSANYVDNQLLVGEILILSNNDVYATLTTNPRASVRDALAHPDYNIKTTIFDNDTLNKIPYFNIIYDYIITKKLKDIIVEFALFNIGVGINNEEIIIYELRTDY